MLAIGILFFSFILFLAFLTLFTDGQSALENYIKSKNVKHPAEVEYWIREYDRRHNF